MVGHGTDIHDVFGLEPDIGEFAVFWRRVGFLVGLEIGLEHAVGWRLDRLDQRLRQGQIVDGAVFAAIERDRLEEGVRSLEAIRNRLDDLLAHRHLGPVLQIVLRPHAEFAQPGFEQPAVELAIRALEGGFLPRQFGQPVLGEAKPELARLFVEDGARHQLSQHLVVDAIGLGLLAADALADLLLQQAIWRS